jgi:hypothetical protein
MAGGVITHGRSVTLDGMQVIDASGRLLDATYFMEPADDAVDLIMESMSGKSEDRPGGHNINYNPALTLLLERLAVLDASMLGAWVDSKNTRDLQIPEDERKIIAAPIRLRDAGDMNALRVKMGRAQGDIAQASGSAGGGNRTKRIRIRLAVPGYGWTDVKDLADLLALPGGDTDAFADTFPRADSQVPRDSGLHGAEPEPDEDLDRIIEGRQRREQHRLRMTLFASRTTATCDLCSRNFPVGLLVAAHIKQRSQCSNSERLDLPNIVMSACRLGCDELFERGYVSVDDDGVIILGEAVQLSEHVSAYAKQYLAGKVFGKSMVNRRTYFAWHRANRFGL